VAETAPPKSYDAWRREVTLHLSHLTQNQIVLGDIRARFLTVVAAILAAVFVFLIVKQFDLVSQSLDSPVAVLIAAIFCAVSGFFCALWAAGGCYLLAGRAKEAAKQESERSINTTEENIEASGEKLHSAVSVEEETDQGPEDRADNDVKANQYDIPKNLFFYGHMATMTSAAQMFEVLACLTDLGLEYALLSEVLRKTAIARRQARLIAMATILLILSVVFFAIGILLKNEALRSQEAFAIVHSQCGEAVIECSTVPWRAASA